MQDNTYDCGVFVIKYAEEVLKMRPKIGARDIKNKLSSYFSDDLFKSQEDIDKKVTF